MCIKMPSEDDQKISVIEPGKWWIRSHINIRIGGN